ncbi:5'-methylthioadenosine/S-adenosylhomocysteine nucleosidase [Fictibacillus nanhaiensis]|uniref:5'-methylthioadenosine/S-adenosylhomocysteine nucleosidase n=1 Tax=Fictibacillus nanhaiensis TaxID=742169 RepID=UPI002E1B4B64|nr:5'-methylthioadenosine/S-adenosylhomocysteine nucleosidase [Fictibacillus nanhaiensis]MED1863141.1 5'-methylthioadenosine/S-adenosylhomocysteine nucleosidase [Fictibacillus nanhaiensis]
MKRIGIIGAMEEEVVLLREQLEGLEEKKLAGCEFYKGSLNGQEIVLLKSGIGKVNAAIGTTLLIQLYEPDVILNTGSAGGFHSDLNVGDVVISTDVRHHDVDATIFGYEHGQVPQMPPNYLPDEKLVNAAERAGARVENIQVAKGLIASGDSFMSDHARVEDIKAKFPTLYAAEMEAAAIAQTCYQFKVPFVIIRSLSDIAGKDARVSYDQFLQTASKNSAELVQKIVEELKSL